MARVVVIFLASVTLLACSDDDASVDTSNLSDEART